jgi:hypothetical protein
MRLVDLVFDFLRAVSLSVVLGRIDTVCLEFRSDLDIFNICQSRCEYESNDKSVSTQRLGNSQSQMQAYNLESRDVVMAFF